jgi:hypothetical protein
MTKKTIKEKASKKIAVKNKEIKLDDITGITFESIDLYNGSPCLTSTGLTTITGITFSEFPISVKEENKVNVLDEISKKLDILIELIGKEREMEKSAEISLSDLNLYDLNMLKETANKTIVINKYSGGDQSILQVATNLSNRIDEEINKRLTKY